MLNTKKVLKKGWVFQILVLVLQISSFAQPANLTKKSQTGDEQGLKIPENIILQQDKDAIQEAVDGWWTESMKTHEKRTEWYKEVKFGCFIHWGVSSPAGNEWNGTGGLGYSEHLMRARKIPLAEYKSKLVETFDPVGFNAEEWIIAAKEAGMKYFIITAKHHDGFAMYLSDAYPYDIRLTRYKRDPMKELRVAAAKHGIKFGFYYSHAFDWEHPDAPGNDWDYQNPGGDKLLHGANWWENYPQFLGNAEKYVDEKSIPQIRELILNYQPDIMWFDTPHKLPLYLNLKILKAIREIAPDIPVNGRLAGMKGLNFGDYINTGDRAAYFRPTPGIWEAIPTTNESYGYNKFDLSHKPPKHFIRLIASAAAKGGNILLNVGPMGNGKWDERDAVILKEIGSWMKTNGESIYGTDRSPLPVQSWGEVTRKDNGLYLHVFQWPDDKKLVVGGLHAEVENAFFLAEPERKLKYERTDNGDLTVHLPAIAPDSLNTVIKLIFREPLEVNPVRLLSPVMPNQLLVFDATFHGKEFTFGDGKPNREYVSNWKERDQYLSWDFRLNEPAEFTISLKFNTEKPDDRGVVYIEVDGKKFQVDYGPADHQSGDPLKRINNPSSTVIAGKIKLEKGNHKLTLRPGEYQGGQLMRPLAVTLLPEKQPLSNANRSGRVTILGLGDSITQGGEGYPSYLFPLWERLFAAGYRFDFIGPRSTQCRIGPLFHSGFGGRNAEYLEANIDSIYRLYPADLVLLHAGHNHFDYEKPVDGIIRAQKSIIQKILNINPKARILVAKVIESGKLPKYSYIPELNKRIGKMARELNSDQVICVDQAKSFNWKKHTIGDKVHPNAAGAEKMAEAWFEAIQKILPSPGSGENSKGFLRPDATGRKVLRISPV